MKRYIRPPVVAKSPVPNLPRKNRRPKRGRSFIRKRREENHRRRSEYAKRNHLLQLMGFNDYFTYLRSDLWKKIRASVFRVKGHKCHFCGAHATAIHHGKYTEKVLMGLDINPLFPVCRTCHEIGEFTDDRRKLGPTDATLRMREFAPEASCAG